MFGDVTVRPHETALRETVVEDEPRSHHGFLHALAWLALALAVAGTAWYFYPTLKQYQAQLTQISGVQKVVDGIGDQVKQTDAKLQSWAGDQQALRDQIGKLRVTTQAQLQTAVKQAEEASTQAYRRIESQIEDRLQGVQNRLAHLESSSDHEQTRLAELQRELVQARHDVANQADKLAAIRRQVEDSGAAHDRELASIKQTQETSRRDVDAIENRLAVRRIDFEVTKNHSRELAEGIALHVTGTDATRRIVSGWMWVLPDRRTIWLKNQNAQQPVVFYGFQDGKKRELVITNVTSSSVTGYLLLPGGQSEPASRSGE